jgi:hypothetical protein
MFAQSFIGLFVSRYKLKGHPNSNCNYFTTPELSTLNVKFFWAIKL